MTTELVVLGALFSLASFAAAAYAVLPAQSLHVLAYFNATYRKGHVEAIVRQLQLRGFFFYGVAVATLAIATAFVGVGVYIFLSATSAFNGIVPDADAALLLEKARTRADVARMLQETADAKSRLELGKDGYDVLRPLAHLSGINPTGITSNTILSERMSLEDSYYVLRALVTREQDSVQISKYPGMTVPDRLAFDTRSIESVRNKLLASKVYLIAAADVVQRLRLLRERIPAIDVLPNEKYDAEVAMARQIVMEMKGIYQKLQAPLETEFAEAKQLQRELDRDAAHRQEQLRLREDQLQILDEQLAVAEQAKAQTQIIAWLPNLTIRIGTVTLLVFLTQMFHSTYRYTSEVATHYLSVATCLQLAAKDPKGINADQALKLMEMLSTKGYHQEKTDSPDLSGLLAKIGK